MGNDIMNYLIPYDAVFIKDTIDAEELQTYDYY